MARHDSISLGCLKPIIGKSTDYLPSTVPRKPKSDRIKTVNAASSQSSTMSPLFKRSFARTACCIRKAYYAAENPTFWRSHVRARHAVFLYQASWSASPLSQRLWISSAISPYTEPLWYAFWTIIQRGSWTVFKRLPAPFAVALPIGLAQNNRLVAASRLSSPILPTASFERDH